MKTKIFVSTVIAALLILCCVLPVGAAQRQDAQYTNPETSYQAIIIDDIDLLTESEEAKLIEEMTPLTEYGNIIFWSTDVHKTDYIDQARVKRRSLYDLDSAAILMINMNTRKVVVITLPRRTITCSQRKRTVRCTRQLKANSSASR